MQFNIAALMLPQPSALFSLTPNHWPPTTLRYPVFTHPSDIGPVPRLIQWCTLPEMSDVGPSGPSFKPPGWFRGAKIGCGLVLVLLFGIMLWSMMSTDRMIVWAVSRLERRVLDKLPVDTPDSVRIALQREMDCVVGKASDGTMTSARLGQFTRLCIDALADKSIAPDEIQSISAMANAICRGESEAPTK